MKFFIENFKLIGMLFVGYTIWYVLSNIFILNGMSALRADLTALGIIIGIIFFLVIALFVLMSWVGSAARAERDAEYFDAMYIEPLDD